MAGWNTPFTTAETLELLEAECKRARQSEDIYRTAFLKYAVHKEYCDISYGCTCGLDDILYPQQNDKENV